MRAAVIQALETAKGMPTMKAASGLLTINNSIVNIRTANTKSGDKYWFDVTPNFYASVHFFLFACGNAGKVYVFPSAVLQSLLVGASLGGQKQVPNFTIFSNSDQFQAAGSGGVSQPIAAYLNAYGQI